MSAITRAEAVLRVLAAARAQVGFTESTGGNDGPYVEPILKLTGHSKGAPWCAAYVSWVGKHALTNPGEKSQWPVVVTAGCAVLGDWAKAKGVLLPASEAQPGDVFLLYYPSMKRFAHTGFVWAPRGKSGHPTLEGNTNGAGHRDGWGCFEKTRAFGARDAVIRWTALLPE